ncbi:MAG: hypothetical protein ACJ8FM_23925 [Xanthobacteraceae bacterium]
MTAQVATRQHSALFSPTSMPLWVGAAIYSLLLLLGPQLLNDPDTYSHVALGRWIIAHRAVPFVDPFTHTAAGMHWVAFEWLSQVMYAAAHVLGGWSAVVVLAAGAVAFSFALLTRFLLRELAPIPTLVLVTAAFVLISPHVLARPHVLAFPIMVIWVATLVRAVDNGERPPFRLLPLMTLWANLHGSFTFGLAIIFPIAFEALWNAPTTARKHLVRQWLAFAVLALLAGSLTPYGSELIEVTHRTIALGPALLAITEWRAQDFSHLGAFEIILLSAFGYALHRRIALPPLRILMLLGLVHLALSQSRHADLLALLAPLFLARPLAQSAGFAADAEPAQDQGRSVVAVAALIAVACVFAGMRQVSPAERITPAAAVAAADLRNAGPILNEYNFGGYLDYVGIAPFIDGRAELYGAAFNLRYHRATTLQSVPEFLQLLKDHKIQATLLAPQTPAAVFLDFLPEWKKVYADQVAVVHVRKAGAVSSAAPTGGASRPLVSE